MAEQFISQQNLAARWGLSERTLERWRWQGKGPRYIKIGHRVRYRLEEIKHYEVVRTYGTGE